MSVEKIIYQLFFAIAALTFLASVFINDLMIYLRPLVIVSLSVLYVVKVRSKSYLVLFSLLVLMTCETLYFYDYLGNFEALHILLSIYYLLNVVLLWKSLQLVKIRFRKVFTIQLIISMSLITYVLISVAKLILPQVNEHSVVLNILVVFFAMFIGVCYYIYLNSMTVVSYSLMVAASCFLIVNIVTALHRLYVPLDVFPVITNVLQISGQFFLVKFFIEQNDLAPSTKDYF